MKKIVKFIGATVVVAILLLNVLISSSNDGLGKMSLISLASLKAANAEDVEYSKDLEPCLSGRWTAYGTCAINPNYKDCAWIED